MSIYLFGRQLRKTGIVLFTMGVSIQAINAQVKPSPYPSGTNVNYIRTWDATAPEQDPVNLISRPLRDVKQATQYFDGLGRPLQTVVRQGSLETLTGTKKDMVSAADYDEFGRESRKYLSFVSASGSGLCKFDPFQEQKDFMDLQYLPQGDSWYYSQANFEASPFNRVEKTMAPGNNWVGSGRGVAMKYWTNTITDDVKKWNVTDIAGSFGAYGTNGYYPAGVLYKNVTADEQGKQVIEFKDKEGKVILKKVQLAVTATDNGNGANYDGWLCTYYIYDDLGNLRCVIQPEGVKTLALPSINWDLMNYAGGVLLNEQCFRYEYDERGRMIMKKVPGAGEVWMVYDARDRLVLTQDANLRASGKWMYTLYDNNLNRPLSSGLWTNAQDRIYHKGQAGTSISYPNLSGQTYQVLTRTFYDNYDWVSTYGYLISGSRNASFDSYLLPASGSSPYPQASVQSLQVKGLVTGTWTNLLGTTSGFSTVNIYDDKSRIIQTQANNISGGLDVATVQYSWAGQSLIMIQKTGGPNGDNTVIVTQNSYDDLGRLTKVEKRQSNPLVTVNGVLGGMSDYATISTTEYDKSGQVKKKTIGGKKDINNNYITPRQPLEDLTYDYNIMGWMLGMNRAYLSSTGQSGSTKFGFELGYDKVTNSSGRNFQGTGLFNGNITGMVWKSDGDDVKRKYDFKYDAVNRLLKGEFEQDDANATWNNTTMNYSIQMGSFNVVTGESNNDAYDDNGNIKAMKQFGWKIGGSSTTPIDNLTYSYYPGSNRLQSVTDAIIADNKLGDFTDKNTTATDYGYDKNGNLITDLNKRLNGATGSELTGGGAITYNYLNLPVTIAVKNDNGTDKGTITYTYDAAGNKLKKVTDELATSANNNIATNTTTLYIGGLIYESKTDNNPATTDYTNKLQFAAHEEGRIRALYDNDADPNLLTGFAYDYMIKDHLGNVRMVLTEEQKQNFYPAATLEGTFSDANTAIGYEKGFYTIDETKIKNNTDIGTPNYPNNNIIPNPYPQGNSGNSNVTLNSQKLYQLNGSTNKTGLGVILKVMAGDKVDIFGKSYYSQNNSGDNVSYNLPVLDLIAALLSSPKGAVTAAHGIVSVNDINSAAGTAIGGFLTNTPRTPTTSTTPRAYINYIILDEQFKYVAGGLSPVGGNGSVKDHYSELQNIPINRNGYIFVYCSNESPVNVFFDNLQVVHTRGPLLEETHYYPFGLSMNGISSKALNFGNPENKKKFNDGTELNTSLDVNLYETAFRLYDPQIGRFVQSDEMAEELNDWSPYTFANDNPILLNDPTGLLSDSTHPVVGQEAIAKSSSKPLTIINSPGVSIRKNPNYNPFNSYSPTYFINRAWSNEGSNEQLTVGQALGNIAIFVPWGRIFKGIIGLYSASKAAQVLRVVLLARFAKLAPFEQAIVAEAKIILNSKNLNILRTAYEKGVAAEISVGGKAILYEPSIGAYGGTFSGLTMFGENGFILGRDAFASTNELGKTILQELYRLATTASKVEGGTGALISLETKAASQFAEKAAEFLK